MACHNSTFCISNRREILVTICSFLSISICLGFQSSSGIWYMYHLVTFKKGATLTSLIYTFLGVTTYVAGPIIGVMANSIGAQKTVVIGAMIATLGYLISAFSESIYMILVFHGLLSGFGMGLLYIPWTEIVSSYFMNPRHRDGAVVFITSGGGFGSFVWSPLIEFLIEYYGWRGAYMISAGICLQVCIFGGLSPLKTKQTKADPLIESKTSGIKSQQNGKCILNIFTSLKMLKDVPYLLLLVSEILFCASFGLCITLMPDFTKRHGHSEGYTGTLLSFFGASNMIAKITASILCFLSESINHHKIYFIVGSAIITGICCFVFTTVGHSLVGLTCVFSIFGAFVGLKHSVIRGFLLNIFGTERVTLAIGNLSMAFGVGMVMGPPLGGIFFDINNSYDGSFYLAGGIALVSVFLYIPMLKVYSKRMKLIEKQTDKNINIDNLEVIGSHIL